MDFIAFDIALFSVVLIFIGFYFARKTSKIFWANAVRIASVILSFIVISLILPRLNMSVESINTHKNFVNPDPELSTQFPLAPRHIKEE